jgi:hypothetical protein
MDVYASFWDIENIELEDTIENFLRIYTPKNYEVESYDIFKQTTQDIASLNIQSPHNLATLFQQTSKAFGQLSMYYKVWRCNTLSKELCIEYDVVIRARIDTILDDQLDIVINDMLNVPMGSNNCPAFSNSTGINDCFAFASPKIMDYYSFIFLQMMEYLKSGHYLFPPEHFLAVHFSKIHIQIREIPTYIMITRVSKGAANEIYNNFINPPREEIRWSDSTDFLPDPSNTFKKDIKGDFIV